METFVHEPGHEFKSLPEVYQLEVCSACNLKCPMCLRTTDQVRPDTLLDLKLLELMHKRGDFRGSYYTELQMGGEPTLHPKLGEIIDYLHDEVGLLVGLSTHGLLIKKKDSVLHALLNLDALTVSVDSIDPEVYHQMRYPAKFPDLLESLDCLAKAVAGRMLNRKKVPFIELQLIHTDLVQGTANVQALEQFLKENFWEDFMHVRTTADCFYEMQGRKAVGSLKRNSEICLNPWMSVSVSSTGDVTSCCYIFEPKKEEINYYGNLYEQSLEEIWNGPRLKAMRESQKLGQLKDQCSRCYLFSPALIHINIASRLIRHRG